MRKIKESDLKYTKARDKRWERYEKKRKELKNPTVMEIIELLQAECKHPKRQVFSLDGHNFLQCLGCGKCFFKEDI